MRNSLTLNILAKLLAIFIVPALLSAMISLGAGQGEQAFLYFLVALICFVTAASLFTAAKSMETEPMTLRDVVSLLFVSWITLSILGAIPFLQAADNDVLIALFEAISCTTTTGSSLIKADLPVSLLLWRGSLHLMGATLTITGSLIVLGQIAKGTEGMRFVQTKPVGLSLKPEGFIGVFGLVFSVLFVLVLASMAVLIMDAISLRESMSLAIGAATTGMVLPYDPALDVAGNWSGMFLSMVLIIACLNTGLLITLFRAPNVLAKDSETIGVLAFMALGFVIVLIISGASPLLSFSEVASIISTSGLLVSADRQALYSIPVIVFLGFLGGSALSAVGGLKVFRMRLLLARTSLEFARLSNPNSVVNSPLLNERRGQMSPIVAVWVYLVGFAMLTALLAAYFAVSGQSFGQSILFSVGAVTNSAMLLPADAIQDGTSPISKLVLMFGMLLGRLELLLIVSLFVRN